MQLTNIFGLPEAIIRATKKRNAAYDSRADRSVTQLINPPQIDILRKTHFKDIKKDVSEEFYALLGSAVHQILEWGNRDGVAEERLFTTVSGWSVSGGVDLQMIEDQQTIIDYKVTSVYAAFKNGDEPKQEWVEQLNLYALLVWLNKGIAVDALKICVILRDWVRKQAETDPTYPQAPILLLPLPVWPRIKQEQFLRDRVGIHQKAMMNYELGEPLPECSPEERWAQAGSFAVWKDGNKKASKVFAEQEPAEKYVEEKGTGYTIEVRPGRSVRCNHCGVSEWCQQYKTLDVKVQDDDE